MLASTGVEARAGLAGVAVPELAAPFFCLLGCLALMSDMIEEKEIKSASLKLHCTNIVLNVLSHTQWTLTRKKTKKTEQNTLKLSKKAKFALCQVKNKNYEPKVVTRSLSARIVGDAPSLSDPLLDVSGLPGLSFFHSILALHVSK